MPDPLYRQIADDLRHKIESGELPPGEQLPTELELQQAYRASRNTVRDALRALTGRGLVVPRPGQGTFVADEIVPFAVTMSVDPRRETSLGGGEGIRYINEVEAKQRHASYSDLRVEIQPATERVARELDVPPGSSVVVRHQVGRIDDKPWSLQTSFYPMELVTLGAAKLAQAEDIQPGTVDYLRNELGIVQVGYRDTLTARPPNDGELRSFQLASDGGAVVIETMRTAFDGERRPMRCTITAWPADRNQLVYNFGDVPPMAEPPEGT